MDSAGDLEFGSDLSQGGAVTDGQSAEQSRNVFFDRLLGKADPVTDLLVLKPLGHQLQHLGLSIRQPPAAHFATLALEPDASFNYT